MDTTDVPVLQLPDGILEKVAGNCSQVELDYFIHCITTGKQDAAADGMLVAGFSIDDANAFIDEVEKLNNDDLTKVEFIQKALNMSDDEMIELAGTILRVLT